jgi:hypothetical protein
LTDENKRGTLSRLTRAARLNLEQIVSRSVWRSQRRIDAMIAALGTLAFLVTLWMLVVVGAAVLEESGAKIAAALKGKVPHQPAVVPVRVRTRSRLQQPIRASVKLRAAA